MPNNAIIELTKQLKQAQRQLLRVQRGAAVRHYRGAQAGNFTTTTLPHHGDYGYQTTDNELQMNCNGTIRAVGMAVL